ncbi:MAG: hypothetical protein EXX96DRAFT_486259 [Benjaminiella poitrasii]|nr:MAG: hypothetical protein EXX96DRAFT_486259 [Benjaminiella poitrasii]
MGVSQQQDEWERRSLKRRASIATLASSIKSPPAHFYALRMPEEQINVIKNKAIREFYKKQNEIIDRFEAVDRVIEEIQNPAFASNGYYGSLSTSSSNSLTEVNSDQNKDTSVEDEELSVGVPLLARLTTTNSNSSPTWIIHLAINLSLVANIVLFLTKVLLAAVSGSMAILASAFESFLDILSNAIIFVTMRLIRQKNVYDYPVGKSRMEPLGIIVFAVVITTSFSQVLISSIERLTEESESATTIDLSPMALALLGANIFIKGALWVWCMTIKGSSSVQALAQDHENDVVFNIASTIFPVLAVWAKLPWLDALGAILLSLYIIYEWVIVLLGKQKEYTLLLKFCMMTNTHANIV